MDTSLFDFPENAGLIRDISVLSHEYIPERIIGRDDEIQKVAYLMKPLFRRGSPNNALVFGPSGCGKTVVTKYVLNSLLAKLEINPLFIKVDWVYIHCKKIYTTNTVLYTLIHHLDPNTKLPKSGYSLNHYYDTLFQLMNAQNTALIVILDEIDFLKSDDVLYNFSRAISNEELKEGRFISVIGLSNSFKFEETLDPRVLSSMGFEKLRFPSYSADPIYHILNDRINIAFAPSSISKETMIACAIDAAQTNGDIRKALNVLKAAATLAENEGARTISISHIKIAEQEVQLGEMIEAVLELPRHHKLILASIVKLMTRNKAVYTGDVRKMYELMCKHVEVKAGDITSVSKSISSLEMQGYIQSTKLSMGKNGGVTRAISIRAQDMDQIKIGLYADEKLETLKDYNPYISS